MFNFPTRKILLAFLFGAIFCCQSVNAKILYVPANYPTIQQAVSAAVAGDTIFVHNGVYYGPIKFKSYLTFIGENNNLTIVDGRQAAEGFTNRDPNEPEVVGVTIQNFRMVNCTNAVSFYDNRGHASPFISGILVLNNTIENCGMAIWMYWNAGRTAAAIKDNRIKKCELGLSVGWADTTVLISGNQVEYCTIGMDIHTYSAPRIFNNLVVRSKSTGIQSSGGAPVIVNNTIVYNGGAGISISHTRQIIKNNILCFNEVAIGDYYANPVIDYNNIWGNNVNDHDTIIRGAHNISYNPLFADTLTYHLLPASPCIDAGDPASDYSNEPAYNGRRIDLGAYGNTPETVRSAPEIDMAKTVEFNCVTVQQRSTFNLKISNTGKSKLNIDSLQISGAGFYLLSPRSTTVMAGDSLSIGIRFLPQKTQDYVGSLTLMTNDEDEPQLSMRLHGVGCLNSSFSGTLAKEHSPYWVSGDVYVEQGQYLSIEAGVVLEFQANTRLFIRNGGRLEIRGAAGDSVLLKYHGQTPDPGWAGIHISGAENCLIDYASFQNSNTKTRGGGILSVVNAELNLANSSFRNCTAAAPSAVVHAKRANISIHETSFVGNRESVIVLGDSASFFISNSRFAEHANQTRTPVDIRNAPKVLFALNLFYDQQIAQTPIQIWADSIFFYHNTIANNVIAGSSQTFILNATAQKAGYIKNNIFWQNRIKRINYSGNCEFAYNLCDSLYSGKGNLAQDPLFAGGNPFDFHLTKNSPAIDAGVALGYPYTGRAPDMGRYESPFTTAVEERVENVPAEFRLFSNFPNPFHANTTIRMTLAKPTRAQLKVYDMLGREVAVLLDDHLAAGEHKINWNPPDLLNGIYFVQLQAGSHIERIKLVRLK